MAIHGSDKGGGSSDGGRIAVRAGTVLCAITDDAHGAGVHEAKDYIAAQGFTREDVKLVKRAGMVMVIALKDMGYGER
jgi:hypothetical protein